MVRLVLFDIDGTLIRTGGAGVRAFAKVFDTEFGLREGFERLKFAGRTDVSLVREFLNYHNLPCTQAALDRFFESYAFWLDEILAQGKTEVCAGIQEAVHTLKRMADPPVLGLLTGNIRLGAEIKLRHVGLWDAFETGAFADDHEDRDCIAAIARERGCRILQSDLRPEQVLVVGDTPLDIRCARAIGAKVLTVATGGAELPTLREHKPDWAVPDLRHVDLYQIMNGDTGTRKDIRE